MTTSIFIRSYRGDREWLRFCLRALAKFASGFSEIIVSLPIEDQLHFDKFDFHGASVKWVQDLSGMPGYLAQQISKLHADEYCKADNILYVDSDCVATAPFSPKEFSNSKPIQLIRHWPHVGAAEMWKAPTTKALGVEPIFEHMACFPLIYDRRTLGLLRDHIYAVHGMSVDGYISSMTDVTFSEFNLLGAFALRYTPHLYEWRIANPDNDGYCRVIKQFYSYDGVEKHRDEIEGILT